MTPLWRRFLLGLLVVLAAVAVRLAFWQLDRLEQRRASNAVIEAASVLPPLDLSLATGDTNIAVGRRLVARGQFERDGQLLLRNRVHLDAPGLHVITPFRVERNGVVLWVLRGFIAAPDAVHPAAVPAPTAGPVTIHAIAAALPVTTDGGRPLAAGGDTTWQRLDSAMAMVRRNDALPVFAYLEGGVAGPGRLAAVVPPPPDEGPHFSYAIQWIGIAATLLAFGWFFVRPRGGREPARPRAAP